MTDRLRDKSVPERVRGGVALALALLLLGMVAVWVLPDHDDPSCESDAGASQAPLGRAASASRLVSSSTRDLYSTLEVTDLVVLVSSPTVTGSQRDGDVHAVAFTGIVGEVLFAGETFNDPTVPVPPTLASAIVPGAGLRFVEGGLASAPSWRHAFGYRPTTTFFPVGPPSS